MATVGGEQRPGRRPWLAVILLAGAAGAALVLLVTRQRWAVVTASAPAPLPARSAAVNGQALIPAAGALGLAAAASLAAMLATRGLLRRATGLAMAALGAGAAAALLAPVSAAAVRAAAAARPAAPGTGTGAGPGSVTGGSAPAGFGSLGPAGHVLMTAGLWRGVGVAGALLIVAAGLLTAWRASSLPVMSARYDRGPGRIRTGEIAEQPDPGGARRVAAAGSGAGPAGTGEPSTEAALWESLSAGLDPTDAAGPGDARPGH